MPILVKDHPREVERKEPSPKLRRTKNESEHTATEYPALYPESNTDDPRCHEDDGNHSALAKNAGYKQDCDADVTPELVGD